MVAKRRRQRWGVLLGSLAVIGAGVLIAFVAFGGDEDVDPQATGDPTATDTIDPARREPVACGGKVPKAASEEKGQFGEPENEKLNPDRVYLLKLQTSCGEIEIELDLERAPKTVNSVAFLAREGFYDGLVFHRLSEGVSVIQGGDPTGNGSGGPGYDVVEPPPDDISYERGIVAMAKGGADPAGTSGSQFFIVFGKEAEALPPDYALLGEVSDGMDVVDEIAKLPNEAETPTEWPYIEKATILLKVGARAGD